MPFPLAHGSAGSREAKAFPAPRSGFGSLRARYRKADKKYVCRPFWGGTFLCGGQLGCRRCIGVHWVVLLFVYCLIWGVFYG